LSHTTVGERLEAFGSQPSSDRMPASERIFLMRTLRAALAVAALAAVALLVPSTAAQAAPVDKVGYTVESTTAWSWGG